MKKLIAMIIDPYQVMPVHVCRNTSDLIEAILRQKWKNINNVLYRMADGRQDKRYWNKI